jgi:DUF4097 and DUF4098 domain-containing protein YvlB
LKSIHCVALAGVWGLTVTGCAFAGSTPPLAKETRTLHVAHVPSSAVQVTTRNGAVTVEASERDEVEIVATLTATTQERLKETQVVAERDASNALIVGVDWAGGKPMNREGCGFRVLLPQATGAGIHTSNGGITIVGLEGMADLEASNGPIEVRQHGGDVKADTSNGPISVLQARGSVAAETSNGPVSIHDPGGRVLARTSNSKIEIVEASQAVTSRTSNGPISVRLSEHGVGPVEAHTSNGSVTLIVGNAFGGDLEMRTSNGSIRVDDLQNVTLVSESKGRRHLRVGSADIESQLETSNGSIHVRSR